MDNILKSIIGVIGVSGACALMVSFINPEALSTTPKPVKVQGGKPGTEDGKLIDAKSNAPTVVNGESQGPKPVEGSAPAAQATNVAVGNTKIIDYSNFGDAMVNPEPVFQIQHTYDPNNGNSNGNGSNSGNPSPREEGSSPKDGTGFDSKET